MTTPFSEFWYRYSQPVLMIVKAKAVLTWLRPSLYVLLSTSRPRSNSSTDCLSSSMGLVFPSCGTWSISNLHLNSLNNMCSGNPLNKQDIGTKWIFVSVKTGSCTTPFFYYCKRNSWYWSQFYYLKLQNDQPLMLLLFPLCIISERQQKQNV